MNTKLRSRRIPRRPVGDTEAFDRIQRAAQTLRVRAFVMKNEQNRVYDAVTILRKPQQSTKRQQYRVFLFDVHKACGPVGVLLCAAELGQHTTTGMRKGDRGSLVKQFLEERNSSIFTCPILRDLARDHGIPQETTCVEENTRVERDPDDNSLCLESLSSEGAVAQAVNMYDEATDEMTFEDECRPQGLADLQEDLWLSADFVQDYSNLIEPADKPSDLGSHGMGELLPTREPVALLDERCEDELEEWTQYAIMAEIATITEFPPPSFEQSASLSLTAVFGPGSSTMINKVGLKTAPSELQRASTGVLFPAHWSLNDSLLSIEVCQGAVDYVVHEFFNSQIIFVEGITTIIRIDGQTLTCADDKVILRGARIGAIAKLLGTSISTAIEGTSFRQQEIQKGKDTTDCVSMTVAENFGTVDIYLSLHVGLDIAQKLGLTEEGNWERAF